MTRTALYLFGEIKSLRGGRDIWKDEKPIQRNRKRDGAVDDEPAGTGQPERVVSKEQQQCVPLTAIASHSGLHCHSDVLGWSRVLIRRQ